MTLQRETQTDEVTLIFYSAVSLKIPFPIVTPQTSEAEMNVYTETCCGTVAACWRDLAEHGRKTRWPIIRQLACLSFCLFVCFVCWYSNIRRTFPCKMCDSSMLLELERNHGHEAIGVKLSAVFVFYVTTSREFNCPPMHTVGCK